MSSLRLFQVDFCLCEKKEPMLAFLKATHSYLFIQNYFYQLQSNQTNGQSLKAKHITVFSQRCFCFRVAKPTPEWCTWPHARTTPWSTLFIAYADYLTS